MRTQNNLDRQCRESMVGNEIGPWEISFEGCNVVYK